MVAPKALIGHSEQREIAILQERKERDYILGIVFFLLTG